MRNKAEPLEALEVAREALQSNATDINVSAELIELIGRLIGVVLPFGLTLTQTSCLLSTAKPRLDPLLTQIVWSAMEQSEIYRDFFRSYKGTDRLASHAQVMDALQAVEEYWGKLNLDKGLLSEETFVDVSTDDVEFFDSPEECGLPNTLTDALIQQSSCPEARVITSADSDQKIITVNKKWEDLCGFSSDEAVGKTMPALVQGEKFSEGDRAKLQALMDGVKIHDRTAFTRIQNFTKCGDPFMNHLSINPLRDAQGKVTHFLGVLRPNLGNISASVTAF